MAIRAIGRGKCCACRRVYRTVRLLPGCKVTARVSAIRRADLQSVVPIDVARAALYGRVLVGQRESRGAVVKHSCRPGGNRVAGSALRRRRREARRDMIRHVPADACRAVERRGVAAVAVGRIQRVVVVDVAGRARRRRG